MARKTKPPRKSETVPEAIDKTFMAALKSAELNPGSDEAWDGAESMSEDMQRPDDVASLYRQVLGRKDLDGPTTDLVARRAVRFHEEWLGDDPDAMSALFQLVLERDPEASWAFDRLVVELTSAKKWDDLLSLYDRSLSRTPDRRRMRELLDQAAQVAKDFADQPGRAVDYLNQLLEIEPENERLIASLERLLEKQERWPELIDLWRSQIPKMRASEVPGARLRIATCLLDKVKDTAGALEALRALVSVNADHPEGIALLERILGLESAPVSVRSDALMILRTSYEAAGRSADLVAAIEKAISFTEPDRRAALLREASGRLADLGDDARAMEHCASLLRLHPADTEARRNLARLASRSGLSDLHARFLEQAAEVTSDGAQKAALLLEAAQVVRSAIGNRDMAIDLYTRVLASGEADETTALRAAHVLDDLLAEAGRREERLEVLDRLASLEEASSVRSLVLGEAARLAREIGQNDRALAAWNTRLVANPEDIEALGEIIDLYDAIGRHRELVEALRRRSTMRVSPQQRREDLLRMSRILDKLEDREAAIGTLLEVRRDFGDEGETISSLDSLLSSEGRWSDLASILETAARSAHVHAGSLLARLGEVLRVELSRPEDGARFLAMALTDEPANEDARRGMKALLEVPSCSLASAEALTRAYSATDDWQGILDLAEVHLASTSDPVEKVRILRRAARIQEDRAQDAGAALDLLARAFRLAPTDVTLERDVARLAAKLGSWQVLVTAFGEASVDIEDNPARAAQIRREQARILETEIGDASGAAEAYETAFRLDPSRIEGLRDVARAAARAGQWPKAARATVDLAAALGYSDTDLFTTLERTADEGNDWDGLAVAVGAAVSERGGRLKPELVSELELKVAVWLRDHGRDLAVAETAAQSAVAHGASHLEGIRLLAELQRRSPGPDLVGTLLKIDALTHHDLDAVHEAAVVALGCKGREDLARSTLEKLYQRAASLLAGSQKAEGSRTAEESASFAIEKLVEMYQASGEAGRAAALLTDAARLPFDRAKVREMRLGAARMLAGMGEKGRAIDLLNQVIGESPRDIETVKKAAELCDEEGRITEVLALRLHELDLTTDPDRKLDLRLGISRLAGRFEEKGGRVESLLANLGERPGHEASISEASDILDRRGQHGRLADILTDQARRLEAAGEPEQASRLWSRVAAIAEEKLYEVERAIDAHGRIVELACTNESLDALARLHLERDEAAAAASWLERRLTGAGDKERVPVLLRLARACLKAERIDHAVSSLETAFSEAPRNAEVRRLLIGIYRERKDWKALARVLTTAAAHVSDEATILEYAREAFEILDGKLSAPAQAAPVLRKAVGVAPEDRELKRMLADALFASGLHEESRALIEELIEGFGRRRSPERAGMHLRLARVARAQGDTDTALDQLETASRMDHGNVDILVELADLARETKDTARAEAAYQTLLVTVRRRPEEEAPPARIGVSEVLLELSRIARAKGDVEQASERLESALEALVQNDAEAPRLQENLREHAEWDLLRRVLTHRLEHVKNPRKRSKILGDLADILEKELGMDEEALDMRLRVVEADALSPENHEAARRIASRTGQTERYITLLEKHLEKARRETDAYIRCELLLRLGEVMEKDKDDLAKAIKYYAAAEETGVREVDVWRAAERVAAARGDTEEQMRLLGKLSSMGEDQMDTRASALYSMAEVHLAQEDMLEEGLSALRRAIEDNPRTERAGVILSRASARHGQSEEFLALYEQVARAGSDDRLLLGFLELRCGRPDTTPEMVREAAELARKIGENERAEALMLRAVDIGHTMPEEIERIGWALLGLAEIRLAAGDLAGSARWLSEARDVVEPAQVFDLGRRVAAAAAGPDEDIGLVSRLYEGLLERFPTAREAWEPLADIYARMGDADRMGRLVESTLDSLEDVTNRNALRFVQARMLIGRKESVEEGIEVLRTILLEDPEHTAARDILVDHFERSGRTEDLVDILRSHLMSAQGRRDMPTIKHVSLRLGAVLARVSVEEAISVYRSSLEWAPQDPDLLAALLGGLGPDHDPLERAELMERMLGSREGKQASSLAKDLADLYDSLSNAEGALRALEAGYRAAPSDESIMARLEERYEASGNHTGLAKLMVEAADRSGDPAVKIALLLKAAAIFREALGDPGMAARILEKATEAAPGDPGIGIELAACAHAAGNHAQAIDKLTELLESERGAGRLSILRLRAAIHAERGDHSASLEDMEEAFSIDTSVAPDLELALDRRRTEAAQGGDAQAERITTLRIVELMDALGRREEARGRLARWIEKAPRDVEALRMLRDIDSESGFWDGVAYACTRLAGLETGEERIDAVLRASHALAEIGRYAEARPLLETAHADNPESADIRAALLGFYEKAGIKDELARLLIEDAMSSDSPDDQTSLLRRAGDLLVEGGRTSEAIPIFHDILEIKPGDVATTCSLVDAYIASGQLGEADRILDGALTEMGGRRSPETGSLLYRKARVAEAAEDLESQLKWLQEAFKTDRHNGQIAAELADLAEATEDWELALQALRATALIKEGCPITLTQSLVRQGRISLRQGDSKRALFFGRKAIKEDAEDPDAKALLKELGEE